VCRTSEMTHVCSGTLPPFLPLFHVNSVRIFSPYFVQSVLGAFPKKLQKRLLHPSHLSVLPFVRVSVCNNSTPTGRICRKFDHGDFYKDVSKQYSCAYNSTNIADTLQEDIRVPAFATTLVIALSSLSWSARTMFPVLASLWTFSWFLFLSMSLWLDMLQCSNFDHYYFIPMVSASAHILMVTMVTFVTYGTDVLTVTTRKERAKTRRIDKWWYNIFISSQINNITNGLTNKNKELNFIFENVCITRDCFINIHPCLFLPLPFLTRDETTQISMEK
jgi:hypothetical protein